MQKMEVLNHATTVEGKGTEEGEARKCLIYVSTVSSGNIDSAEGRGQAWEDEHLHVAT